MRFLQPFHGHAQEAGICSPLGQLIQLVSGALAVEDVVRRRPGRVLWPRFAGDRTHGNGLQAQKPWADLKTRLTTACRCSAAGMPLKAPLKHGVQSNGTCSHGSDRWDSSWGQAI